MAIDTTALLLARIQFAFTISFHFIFPAFSIGLASYLAVLEGLWLKTGKSLYLDLFKYWLKIFAVAFAMGVVSGIVMSYQFGTNWSVFSDKAGPVIGPLMAYEVLTAFFLEAGFLGVMLFGMNKVGQEAAFRRDADGRARHRQSRPSGSSRSTAGCRRRSASRWAPTGSSCRGRAGGRSSSIPASPIASSTPSSPHT